MRRGDGYGPGAIRDAADEIRREREARYPAPTRRGGWYTKARTGDGTVHLMIGPDGDITSERPHVHVIHDEHAGNVKIGITLANGAHPEEITLPGSASGNDVNGAIARMVKRMNELS